MNRSTLHRLVARSFAGATGGLTVIAAAILLMRFDWAQAQQSHWSWQPVRRPEIPLVKAVQLSNEVVHPIDNFVIARRSQAGTQVVVPAAAHILARRIFIDLIGISPTPEQVQSFTAAAYSTPLGNNQVLLKSVVGRRGFLSCSPPTSNRANKADVSRITSDNTSALREGRPQGPEIPYIQDAAFRIHYYI